MSEHSDNRTEEAPTPRDGITAYEPPRIVESARFETLAQGCQYADILNCLLDQTQG